MNGFLNNAQLWHLIGICEGEVPLKKAFIQEVTVCLVYDYLLLLQQIINI